jgi:natural product biosynthesis luciferase-like monooxygenase protein
MKLGCFFLLELPQWKTQRQIYQEALEQAALAEALGFDAVWLAEHHFSEYGTCPSPSTFGAAVAQRTRRVRIGTAVVILPFGHPIRIAEEFAMLDNLSDGRLDFGIGRGYQPTEYAGFNLAMDESRHRFDESLEIIKQAWTQERVNFEGKFFQVRDIPILPKPVQQPHPPIWIAAVSPESFEAVAKKGYRFLSAPSITPPALMKQSYENYRRAWAETGRPLAQLEIPALHFTYVGESEPQARHEPRESAMWYFKIITRLIAPERKEDVSSQYHFYGKAKEHLQTLEYDQLYQDVLLFGDSSRVIDRLQFLQDELGVNYLLSWMNFGGLDGDLARASMRRFAEKVMPRFR